MLARMSIAARLCCGLLCRVACRAGCRRHHHKIGIANDNALVAPKAAIQLTFVQAASARPVLPDKLRTMYHSKRAAQRRGIRGKRSHMLIFPQDRWCYAGGGAEIFTDGRSRIL